MSTPDSHIRSHSLSQPSVHVAAAAAHAPVGYSETKHSGNTTNLEPSAAASPMRPTVFAIVASASRITGVACTAATRTVSNDAIRNSSLMRSGERIMTGLALRVPPREQAYGPGDGLRIAFV